MGDIAKYQSKDLEEILKFGFDLHPDFDAEVIKEAEFISEGGFAKVYDLNNGWVLKATQDVADAIVSAAQMKLKINGIIPIKEVFKLGDTHEYFIVAKKAKPLPAKRGMSRWDIVYYFLEDYLAGEDRFSGSHPELFIHDYGVKKSVEMAADRNPSGYMTRAAYLSTPRHVVKDGLEVLGDKVIKQIESAIDNAAAHDIIFRDLHGGNWMLYKNRWTIIDLGFSMITSDKDYNQFIEDILYRHNPTFVEV